MEETKQGLAAQILSRAGKLIIAGARESKLSPAEQARISKYEEEQEQKAMSIGKKFSRR